MAGDTGQPKWRNVADDITRRIDADEWPIGAKIPSITRLEDHYDVSRNVVLKAVGYLQDKGILEGHGGSGNYVKAKSSGIPLSNEELTKMVRDLEERLARLEQQTQPPTGDDD